MTTGLSGCGGLVRLDPVTLAEFSSENRFVQRFAHYDECEVLIVGWEPGQESSFHDHGDSQSVVILVQGKMTASNGAGSLDLSTGGVLITPVGVKHQMANVGQQRAITVHVYAPPVPGIVSAPFLDHPPSPET